MLQALQPVRRRLPHLLQLGAAEARRCVPRHQQHPTALITLLNTPVKQLLWSAATPPHSAVVLSCAAQVAVGAHWGDPGRGWQDKAARVRSPGAVQLNLQQHSGRRASHQRQALTQPPTQVAGVAPVQYNCSWCAWIHQTCSTPCTRTTPPFAFPSSSRPTPVAPELTPELLGDQTSCADLSDPLKAGSLGPTLN